MFCRLKSATVLGVAASIIEIEVDLKKGLPLQSIVGLPDTAVKEAKERVSAAIRNSGYQFPLGSLTINLAPADIGQIIREALSLYREAHKDIKLIFEDSKKAPVFNLDREQMKRVMINLIENAIEAIGGKGEVFVGLDYDSDLRMVRIEIADQGKGISPENKTRLFEPYFSTKKQGTGLGLAIVNSREPKDFPISISKLPNRGPEAPPTLMTKVMPIDFNASPSGLA